MDLRLGSNELVQNPARIYFLIPETLEKTTPRHQGSFCKESDDSGMPNLGLFVDEKRGLGSLIARIESSRKLGDVCVDMHDGSNKAGIVRQITFSSSKGFKIRSKCQRFRKWVRVQKKQ